MKQAILIVLLLIDMSATTHAQGRMQNENADAQGRFQNENTEQQVTTALQQMADAFSKSDASLLEKCFADTYIFTDPGGAVHNKKDMIDYMKGGNFKFESVIPSDRKITIYENTAVVTEHTTEKGHVGGEDIAGEYRWTYIFFKQDGSWKIIAGQGNRLAPGK